MVFLWFSPAGLLTFWVSRTLFLHCCCALSFWHAIALHSGKGHEWLRGMMFLSSPVMHPGFSCCVLDPPLQEISVSSFPGPQALEHHSVHSGRLQVQESFPVLCSASILQLAIHVFSKSSGKIGDWVHSHRTSFMTATWGYKAFIKILASFSLLLSTVSLPLLLCPWIWVSSLLGKILPFWEFNPFTFLFIFSSPVVEKKT